MKVKPKVKPKAKIAESINNIESGRVEAVGSEMAAGGGIVGGGGGGGSSSAGHHLHHLSGHFRHDSHDGNKSEQANIHAVSRFFACCTRLYHRTFPFLFLSLFILHSSVLDDNYSYRCTFAYA